MRETCYENVISDLDVLRRYLAVRDAYPTMALKYSRVIALSGMTMPAIELFKESLRHQEMNPANVDLYFFSDSKLGHVIDTSMVVPLISLSEFTHPRQIVFGKGSMRREGMAALLQWMVDNREKGYFTKLEYFQVTDHQIALYNGTEEQGDALQQQIVDCLSIMCSDYTHFPGLYTINFNSNGYSSSNDPFATAIKQSCGYKSVSAEEWSTDYSSMCSTSSYSYWYYDMYDPVEVEQCRFTWNWEVDSPADVYAPAGPFPDATTAHCPTVAPTTIVPSTKITLSSTTGTAASTADDLRALLEEAVRGYTDDQKAGITELELNNNIVDFDSLVENPISLMELLESIGINNVSVLILRCNDSDTCGDAFDDFYDFPDARTETTDSRRLMETLHPSAALRKRFGNLRK